MSSPGHEWTKHEREGWSVCRHCGMVRNYDRETTTCSGALPKVRQRSEIEDCGQDGVCKLSPGCNRHWEERNRELVRERDEARAFLRRTAMTGGSIVSSAAMTATQIAIARAADRMLVMPDGYGFVYVPGPRFCACGRLDSDCDQSRAACPKKTVQLHVTTGMTMTTHWAEHAREEDEESDIIIAGRQVPFVQVGMIVHPDDCLNCERDGSPLWCSALVCDIHDDDETARFGMMATLLFRNGERREEPCDELRRRWRLARDFDQGRVYTGRWGIIPRGSVWPVAEVNEDA